MNFETQIREALQATNRYKELHKVVTELKNQGYSQEVVYEILTQVWNKLSEEQNEEQEDALLEIMDVVVNFCLESERIWKE